MFRAMPCQSGAVVSRPVGTPLNVGSFLAPLWVVLSRSRAGFPLRAPAESPSTNGLTRSALGRRRVGRQRRYSPLRPHQQLVAEMAPGQADDLSPGLGDHPARHTDQGETDRLETLAGPLPT